MNLFTFKQSLDKQIFDKLIFKNETILNQKAYLVFILQINILILKKKKNFTGLGKLFRKSIQSQKIQY